MESPYNSQKQTCVCGVRVVYVCVCCVCVWCMCVCVCAVCVWCMRMCVCAVCMYVCCVCVCAVCVWCMCVCGVRVVYVCVCVWCVCGVRVVYAYVCVCAVCVWCMYVCVCVCGVHVVYVCVCGGWVELEGVSMPHTVRLTHTHSRCCQLPAPTFFPSHVQLCASFFSLDHLKFSFLWILSLFLSVWECSDSEASSVWAVFPKSIASLSWS